MSYTDYPTGPRHYHHYYHGVDRDQNDAAHFCRKTLLLFVDYTNLRAFLAVFHAAEKKTSVSGSPLQHTWSQV